MIVYVDWSDWLLLLEVLILCLAAGAVGMLHIYASIAVGHLARKHRTLQPSAPILALQWR